MRGPYDLIVCNPPYVNAQSMAALPPEHRHERCAGAWPAVTTAWTWSARILKAAPALLTRISVVVLEIGNERAHFEHAFRKLEVRALDTSAGDDQVLLVTRAALQRWVA